MGQPGGFINTIRYAIERERERERGVEGSGKASVFPAWHVEGAKGRSKFQE